MLPCPERIPVDSGASLRTSWALQVDACESFVPEVLRHHQVERIECASEREAWYVADAARKDQIRTGGRTCRASFRRRRRGGPTVRACCNRATFTSHPLTSTRSFTSPKCLARA